jgi:membrane-associated phospholipid phosphatase
MMYAPLAVLTLSLASPVQPSGPAAVEVAAAAPAPLTIAVALPAGAAAETAAEPPGRPAELRLALDTAIVTAVTVEALKRTFKDERPVGSGYAFPSGHATTSLALARVASEYHPRYKWLWYAIAARVAWSRVKVRAHDWDDVLAGAALGCWLGDREVASGGIALKRWEW